MTIRTHSKFKEDVIAMHRSGVSPSEIRRSTGLPKHVVMKRLVVAGIRQNPALYSERLSAGLEFAWKSKSKVPGAWSFLPLTAEKAWLLGLIFGDGSLLTRGDGFNITIQDRDVLEKVNAMFDNRLTITRSKVSDCYQLVAQSCRLFRELRDNFSLVPNKSHRLVWPDLAPDLYRHFIRGLIDTDGTICISKRNVLCVAYYSATKSFVERFRSTVNASAEITSRARAYKGKATWNTAWINKQAIQVAEWLFTGDTEHMRCERKFQNWRRFATSNLSGSARTSHPAS